MEERWCEVLEQAAVQLHVNAPGRSGQHRQQREREGRHRPGRADIPAILASGRTPARIEHELLRSQGRTLEVSADQVTDRLHGAQVLTGQTRPGPTGPRPHQV